MSDQYKWLLRDDLRAMFTKYNGYLDWNSQELASTSKTFQTELEKKVDKTAELVAGAGLHGGGNLSESRTLEVKPDGGSILVSENGVRVNLVDDLLTGGTESGLTAEQGRLIGQELGKRLLEGGYKGTAQDLKDEIDTKLSKTDLPTLPSDVMRTGNYNGTGQDLKDEIDTKLNKNDLPTLPADVMRTGNYNGTGENLKKEIDEKLSVSDGDTFLKRGSYTGTGETLNEELAKVKTDIYSIFGAEVSGFIQDEGVKHTNELYIDKNTYRVYRCRVATFTTINSADYFEPKSLVNPTDLSWKLIPGTGDLWVFDADIVKPEMEVYYDANELMFVIEHPGTGSNSRQCHVILNSAARGKMVCCRVNEKAGGYFCVEGREDNRDYLVYPGTGLSDVRLKGVYWR